MPLQSVRKCFTIKYEKLLASAEYLKWTLIFRILNMLYLGLKW